MGTDFAVVGRLLSNQARSIMIDRLMDGEPIAAGELARVAGVAASTASEHLGELVRGGLVKVVPRGRNRYFVIASSDVAGALESLAQICGPTPVRSLRKSREAERLAFFRTCYDHLAGFVAVAMRESMARKKWLIPGSAGGYELSVRGKDRLHKIGVDIGAAQRRKRAFARDCLDWTERRSHLGGALGASVAEAFLTNGWGRKLEGGRGLILTADGRSALVEHYDLAL